MERPAPRQLGSWLDAEENAVAWMRTWGYEDATVERAGPDAGIEVRSTRAVARVTFESEATGRRVLQQLVGASDVESERRFCFAQGHYTSAAVEYADAWGIALFVYDPWGQVEPANRHAQDLNPAQPVRRASRLPDPDRPRGLRAHIARSWMVYLGLLCFVGPFITLFVEGFYGGPAWLDVIKVVGLWFGLWAVGSVLMLTHALRLPKDDRP